MAPLRKEEKEPVQEGVAVLFFEPLPRVLQVPL
jgi:hypothetical protein